MRLVLTALFVVAGLTAGHAQEDGWQHATALVGTPKYPVDFPHFDYVNPDAPKGGVARLSETGGFDTLNPIPAKGNLATGLGLIFETLMTSSLDETSTMYGLIAEAMRYPDDYSSVSFRLRPEARWHDGQPITPQDVVWSFEKLVELNPTRAFYYQNVTGAEVSGEHEVTFTFDQTGNRELPHIVGQLLIFPKHWWEGTDAEGRARDVSATTLEPPLGSGPYRIESVAPGKTMTYRRLDDYWGADLAVNRGKYNFDEVRYESFLDLTIAFEAFKADTYDWRDENQAKRWATAYNFPAVERGDVVLEEFENAYRDIGIMVAFIPNLRREMFQDERVREALNYAFDFETLRRTIFFGQYERIDSYFYGTELSAGGLPEGRELEILESVRDLVPEEVFTEPYVNPVAGDTPRLRENLRAALELLQEAGYRLDGARLVNAETGEQLSFEIILNGPTIEPVALAWRTNLRQIGIEATVRPVDTAQYVNRVRSRDFDVIYSGWAQTLSPGNEQRNYWGSEAADSPSSQNYAGIADPGVDALIDRLVLATDRDDLIAATRALDRVLLAHHYLVPSYALRQSRIARWDRFARPDTLPEFSIGFPTVWWWDEARATAIREGSQ